MDIKSLDPAKAFLGVGWSFPVSPQSPSGEVSLAAYEEDIRQALAFASALVEDKVVPLPNAR